ncbi:TglA family RiPP precursor [Paraherbaspirillum soli]|uniref:TglA family RiPP n=1 Tax=Paraherbaspirillum soli TaxID=631222 RepID=A0ABW0M9C0_9BURK
MTEATKANEQVTSNMNNQARAEADKPVAVPSAPADASQPVVSGSSGEAGQSEDFEDFSLDDIEVIESKVFA